jgi:hypothetical protein
LGLTLNGTAIEFLIEGLRNGLFKRQKGGKKMKKAPIPVLILVFALSAAISWAIHETTPAETQVIPPPPPDGERVAKYILRDMPYANWALWPGKGRLYKGSEPHGALLTTYVNDAALGSIKEKKGMRDGSMIATENYSAGKKLISLIVMYRQRGYNPGGGDWFWARYDAGGKLLESGKLEGCIKCHGTRSANDYIYTDKVK